MKRRSRSARRPLHGYALVEDVLRLSDGQVRLDTGTLYGVLDRLRETGLIVVALAAWWTLVALAGMLRWRRPPRYWRDGRCGGVVRDVHPGHG